MKKPLLWLLVLMVSLSMIAGFSLAGCKTTAAAETTATTSTVAEETKAAEETTGVVASERKTSYNFIFVNNMTTLAFFRPDAEGVNMAIADIKSWTGDVVNVELVGPAENDKMKEVEAMEAAISKKPDGFIVIPWDPNMMVAPINKATDAGIPVIAVDADCPNSNRLMFIGQDWNLCGKTLAKELAKLMGEKGKVAMLGLLGQDDMETAFAAFKKEIATYPNMEVVALEEDKGDMETAASVASTLMQKNPDLGGFVGFDAGSAPGIAAALREAGKVGEIKLVGNNITVPILQSLADGAQQFATGQKRQFYGYYGTLYLWLYLNTSVRFTSDDVKAGIKRLPDILLTGNILANDSNKDLLMEAFKKFE